MGNDVKQIHPLMFYKKILNLRLIELEARVGMCEPNFLIIFVIPPGNIIHGGFSYYIAYSRRVFE